ncbi:hypothetical protein VTG60DRAFT_4532 [Thermothelomyces hinnuleus]
MSSQGSQTAFVPGRLISHFSGRRRSEQVDGWSALWESEQSDLWDRGKPSPALVDLVESPTDLIPRSDGLTKHRPRVLVPGCGKGYDVVMLALHGYDAYGLDVSLKGLEMARAHAAAQLAAPSEDNFSSSSQGGRYPASERGHVRFVVGDFFARDWESDCCSDGEVFSGFDLIYDYTFLCALLPEMRKHWARRMGELLAPSGVLVCLEFPLYKDLSLPGPPWGLREGIYWNVLAVGGDGMMQDEAAARNATHENSESGAFKRLAYVEPERTYEVAKGTDMLSIWGLKERACCTSTPHFDA